jgi:hypothetical protein
MHALAAELRTLEANWLAPPMTAMTILGCERKQPLSNMLPIAYPLDFELHYGDCRSSAWGLDISGDI